MSPTKRTHRQGPGSSSVAAEQPGSKRSRKVSRVAKASKRGWPKGKPRKQQRFPFMRLPLELRCHIYGMALPYQDVPTHSKEWSKILGYPNDSMNLLLVSKQVSDEARNVLYGLNRSTMIISAFCTFFQGSLVDTWFQPISPTPSMPYIKNWQLALWPMSDSFDDRHFRDAVLTACSEIAKIPKLQTLKLAMPCLCERLENLPPRCHHGHCYRSEHGQCSCLHDLIGDVHDSFVCSFAPLNQLRFNSDVQIVSTPKPPRSESYSFGSGLSCHDYPRRFPQAYHRQGYIKLSQYSHEQCQQPLCLRFAASFEYIRATLLGDTTPLGLTKQQIEWLDLKRQVAKVYPEENLKLYHALSDAWDALDSDSEEYWNVMSYRINQILEDLPSKSAIFKKGLIRR
ncbi:MAG: hypothetical protein Q9213_002474 [Squamulea squamosa]